MFNNRKNVFIGKNKEEMLLLKSKIEEITQITLELKPYLESYLLIASNQADYYGCIFKGIAIAFNEKYDVKYIDVCDNLKEVNKFCICLLTFIKYDKKDEKFAKLKDLVLSYLKTCYKDITLDFIKKESDFEEVYEIYFDLNSIKFSRKLSDFYKQIRLIAENYSFKCNEDELKREYELSTKIIFFDLLGNIIIPREVKLENDKKMLKDYFLKSSVYLGIIHPEGCNIAPKSKNCFEFDKLNDEYYISSQGYRPCLGKEISCKILSNGINVNFETNIFYEESYRLNFNSNKMKEDDFISLKKSQQFSVLDKLDLDVEIFKESETKLIVKAKVDVKRECSGIRLTNVPAVYSAFYNDREYKSEEFSFTVTDYYEIIDLNLLVHYTDFSKFYETYNIPLGFEFEDSLVNFENTKSVYDDQNADWICFNDSTILKQILIAK